MDLREPLGIIPDEVIALESLSQDAIVAVSLQFDDDQGAIPLRGQEINESSASWHLVLQDLQSVLNRSRVLDQQLFQLGFSSDVELSNCRQRHRTLLRNRRASRPG